MKGMLVTIGANGKITEKLMSRAVKLSDLRSEVGGYIEVIPHFTNWRGYNCVAFCNEEGKFHNLPFNKAAQSAWEHCVGHLISTDMLVGDVVICYGDDAFMRAL